MVSSLPFFKLKCSMHLWSQPWGLNPSTILCCFMCVMLRSTRVNNDVPHRHFIQRPRIYPFLCRNNNNNNNINNTQTTTVGVQQKRWYGIKESPDGAGDINGISTSYMSATVNWEHGNWKQANRRLNVFWLQPYASGSAFGLTDFLTLHTVAFTMNGALRNDKRAPHMYSEGT
jgi:hypothetical protein